MPKDAHITFIPILHYTMECAVYTHELLRSLKPDCIALELPEQLQQQFELAASRLPDISCLITSDTANNELIYLVEPCDALFEALRFAQEHAIKAFCIDLDVQDYPEYCEPFPDSYAIAKIGLETYYEAYKKTKKTHPTEERELFMAQKLKELALRYNRVVCVTGFSHVENIQKHLEDLSYPTYTKTAKSARLVTLTEESCRNVMAEYGWISGHYELWREEKNKVPSCHYIDRKKLIIELLKAAEKPYEKAMQCHFSKYTHQTLWKYSKNLCFMKDKLLPDLYDLLVAAKGCLDSNYAYEVWKEATNYPHLKNIDNLEALSLSCEQVWKHTSKIRFHLKHPSTKAFQKRHQKEHNLEKSFSQNSFSICSYQKEDLTIEAFANWVKKRGQECAKEATLQSIPFSACLEDGIDTKETIRHLTEKKLYVKKTTKKTGQVGSIVVIFDEDTQKENIPYQEKYPWKLSWLGEHTQESDMAFYATPMTANIIGPGIAACEYGGFLMTYPPRRLCNVWDDPDYMMLSSKADVLVASAIDYSREKLVVVVSEKKPQAFLKKYASSQGKQLIHLPLSQFSKRTLLKLRYFHVLDSHERRKIADDYIY